MRLYHINNILKNPLKTLKYNDYHIKLIFKESLKKINSLHLILSTTPVRSGDQCDSTHFLASIKASIHGVISSFFLPSGYQAQFHGYNDLSRWGIIARCRPSCEAMQAAL
jgi:hypothetical protein